jgi:hypothetical protein
MQIKYKNKVNKFLFNVLNSEIITKNKNKIFFNILNKEM